MLPIVFWNKPLKLSIYKWLRDRKQNSCSLCIRLVTRYNTGKGSNCSQSLKLLTLVTIVSLDVSCITSHTVISQSFNMFTVRSIMYREHYKGVMKLLIESLELVRTVRQCNVITSGVKSLKPPVLIFVKWRVLPLQVVDWHVPTCLTQLQCKFSRKKTHSLKVALSFPIN